MQQAHMHVHRFGIASCGWSKYLIMWCLESMQSTAIFWAFLSQIELELHRRVLLHNPCSDPCNHTFLTLFFFVRHAWSLMCRRRTTKLKFEHDE